MTSRCSLLVLGCVPLCDMQLYDDYCEGFMYVV